jgi:hypothetical protein
MPLQFVVGVEDFATLVTLVRLALRMQLPHVDADALPRVQDAGLAHRTLKLLAVLFLHITVALNDSVLTLGKKCLSLSVSVKI